MRKRRAVKRDVLADPIYNSKVVTKLINTIMLDGKKGIAQTIVYDAFDIFCRLTPWYCRYNKNPLYSSDLVNSSNTAMLSTNISINLQYISFCFR